MVLISVCDTVIILPYGAFYFFTPASACSTLPSIAGGLIRSINYDNGFWGFADLVNSRTGEVWEVKKDTVSTTSATKQLAKYVTGKLHIDQYLELHVGGSQGTVITERRIIKHFGPLTYHVHYWDCGNGIIQYRYDTILNWEAVEAVGWILLGGVVFIITQGLYGPELVRAP